MSDMNPSAAEPPASFEAALTELQTIVSELEDGSIGLEESLARYERGMTLLKTCYQVLERAEQRIEVLVGQKPDGTPATEPFDASATADAESPAAGRRHTKRVKTGTPPQANAGDEDINDDTGFLF